MNVRAGAATRGRAPNFGPHQRFSGFCPNVKDGEVLLNFPVNQLNTRYQDYPLIKSEPTQVLADISFRVFGLNVKVGEAATVQVSPASSGHTIRYSVHNSAVSEVVRC